jgi:hypothetical protein
MRPTIKPLSNREPHPDWGGWQGFLASCEIRDRVGETTYYGKTNCNYILFPDGTLLENYGYHGREVMERVRKLGWKRTLRSIQTAVAKINAILKEMRDDPVRKSIQPAGRH